MAIPLLHLTLTFFSGHDHYPGWNVLRAWPLPWMRCSLGMTINLDEMFSRHDHSPVWDDLSSRVMGMPGEHLIPGNGHARRTSQPGTGSCPEKFLFWIEVTPHDKQNFEILWIFLTLISKKQFLCNKKPYCTLVPCNFIHWFCTRVQYDYLLHRNNKTITTLELDQYEV
jgi:hypothetical protein